MSGQRTIRHIAEQAIRRACRRLPDDIRDERYREWVAELPAILGDPDIRVPLLRTVQALRYAAGSYQSARRLRRDGENRQPVRHAPLTGTPGGTWTSGSPRRGLTVMKLPDGALPGIAAVISLFLVIAVVRLGQPSGAWLDVTVVAAFVPEVLALVALVRFGLWLRRRRNPPRT